MLNNPGIKTTTKANVNQILFAPDMRVGVGIVVDETAGTSDGAGKKIVKAGTPLTGSLDARTTAFTAAATADGKSNAVGILEHDVDVTDGDANGSLIIFGFVNTNRIDATTKAKLTSAVKAAVPLVTMIAM